VLETLSGILMLDVHLPLADGWELVLAGSTQPKPGQRLVLMKLGMKLPPHPPPRLRSAQVAAAAPARQTKVKNVVETLLKVALPSNALRLRPRLNHEIWVRPRAPMS
jgi:hypothetical protein